MEAKYDERSLDLNEILGIRIFDEYIAVIHCTADNERIYQLQKQNSLLCKNCLKWVKL
jgi:hypothetical protein